MEFKVLNTEEKYGEDWGDGPSMSADIVEVTYGDKKSKYTVKEDEPEDMIFGRSLEDCGSIIEMIKMAHEAGKNGHELIIDYVEEK